MWRCMTRRSRPGMQNIRTTGRRPSVADPSIQTAVRFREVLPIRRNMRQPRERPPRFSLTCTQQTRKTSAYLGEEAARAALAAGINYPSDIIAGLQLGRAVGAKVVAMAQNDGSQAVWTGSVPTGPGFWVGPRH